MNRRTLRITAYWMLVLGLLSSRFAIACPDAMQADYSHILQQTMSESTLETNAENAIQNYYFVAVSAARRRDQTYKRAACELLSAALSDTGRLVEDQDLLMSCTDALADHESVSYEETVEWWQSIRMPIHLPIVRVAPAYPARARSKKMEGHVDFEFTVTTDGRTTDVSVLQSTDRIFEKPAKAAVGKFRYKPCVSNGRAIANPNVQTRVYFQLQENDSQNSRPRLW